MKTEVVELSPTRREIKIEIEPQAVKSVYDSVSKTYATRANIPGFRKGHAPLEVVRVRFKEEIDNDVLRQLLPGYVSDAIKQHNISPLGEPDLHLDNVETTKLNGTEPVSVHVHVDVMPEVPMPDHTGLEVVRRVRPVTDEELEHLIDERRRENSSFVPVEDRKSQNGDTLIVDLEGKFVNKPEEDPIKAQDLQITLGDDKIEKSFTENLVGLEADDEKEFTVTYAEDFTSPGLAGQTVAYRAKVKSLGKVEIPAADDDWAKSLEEGFSSMSDLRAKLRSDLELAAKSNADARLRDELIGKLLAKHKFEVPKALLDIQARNLLNGLVQDMRGRGMNVENIKNDTLRAIYEQMLVQAENDVRGAMLLEKIAEVEKIEVTGDEIASEIEKMAQYYDVTPEEVRTSLSKQGSENSISDRLRSRKAVERLVDKAFISEGEWIDESAKIPEASPNPEPEHEIAVTSDNKS